MDIDDVQLVDTMRQPRNLLSTVSSRFIIAISRWPPSEAKLYRSREKRSSVHVNRTRTERLFRECVCVCVEQYT